MIESKDEVMDIIHIYKFKARGHTSKEFDPKPYFPALLPLLLSNTFSLQTIVWGTFYSPND